MNFGFEIVPPPNETPAQPEAQSLGLVRGLRAEPAYRDGWRCTNCQRMQTDRGPLIWVPDSVRRSDSAADVTEQCRVNAYNGHASAWCLRCATKLGKPLNETMVVTVVLALMVLIPIVAIQMLSR